MCWAPEGAVRSCMSERQQQGQPRTMCHAGNGPARGLHSCKQQGPRHHAEPWRIAVGRNGCSTAACCHQPARPQPQPPPTWSPWRPPAPVRLRLRLRLPLRPRLLCLSLPARPVPDPGTVLPEAPMLNCACSGSAACSAGPDTPAGSGAAAAGGLMSMQSCSATKQPGSVSSWVLTTKHRRVVSDGRLPPCHVLKWAGRLPAVAGGTRRKA